MADEKVYLGKDQLALVWQLIKNAFVAKVDGKGLSANDLTDELRDKLIGLATITNSSTNGAIKINGNDETVYTLPIATASILGGVMIGAGLSVDSAGKLINEITKLSQLENDAGFITTSDIPEGAAASTTTPKMNGTADVGKELAFARGDHVHPSDTAKVDKEPGKGLSTNDLTDTLKSNYDAAYTYSTSPHAPTNAERNIIVGIQKNGTDVAVDTVTRKVNMAIPTKVSDLTNDAGFVTDAYTKAEIDSMVSSALEYKGTKSTYDDLPTAGNKTGDVWNVETADDAHSVRAGDNVAWNGTGWDVLAGTIDLSGYMQIDDIRAMTEAEINAICV